MSTELHQLDLLDVQEEESPLEEEMKKQHSVRSTGNQNEIELMATKSFATLRKYDVDGCVCLSI